jgi:hypothetical protein
MFTCKETAFSAPPVICEVQLFYSNFYQPSDLWIQWQNLYLPHSWQCTGRLEAQHHEPVNKGRNFPVESYTPLNWKLSVQLFDFTSHLKPLKKYSLRNILPCHWLYMWIKAWKEDWKLCNAENYTIYFSISRNISKHWENIFHDVKLTCKF